MLPIFKIGIGLWALFVIGGFTMIRDSKGGLRDDCLMFTIFGAPVIAVVFTAFISLFFLGEKNHTTNEQYTRPIISLNYRETEYSNSGGAFILFLGAYRSESGVERKYVVYEEVKKGVYKKIAVSDDILLKESNESPKIVYKHKKKYTTAGKNSHWVGNTPGSIVKTWKDEHIPYMLIIPKNTIIREFKVR